MDEYEIDSKITGLRNFVVTVRGTDVTCYLGVFDRAPDRWAYSLWTMDDELINADSLDMSGLTSTPEQVARIAYLCDVDYA